ncbi:glycosyl hydrolase family 8 [Chitinivibrio alkaliphilus]|uniref:cellulase n=1 Tax=Chitinivibrio alkaliphilus ACht1 TaxID=1313304 RepID=U7DAB1_9BACT|nr:glycosyl hydrolase family 8 [Chitinivibrio alkaliphilus]ERP32072.1 glycoside hydrolase, GH8 family [Chitinivibrio alkaliphilus ACht1]
MAVSFLLCLFFLCVPVAARVHRPFPQEVDYSRIYQVSEHTPSEVVATYYSRWKDAYLMEYEFTNGAYENSGRGYVLQAETNPSDVSGLGETISQSEAHGWAMIITVLMAGEERQAREIFDGLYRVFRNWSCKEHDDLMSWAVPLDGDLSSDRRLPSATDGDMDVAYALLLAHEQWGEEVLKGLISPIKRLLFVLLQPLKKIISSMHRRSIPKRSFSPPWYWDKS